MRLIFISDLHLTINTPKKNQLFYSYLQKWNKQIDGLYILGDLFDAWLGDDVDDSFTREIKEHFYNFTRTTPIYLCIGNHDFSMGKRFSQETGVKLISDLTTISLGKEVALLSHGDTFCTLDVGYQRLKKILQNPVILFCLKNLPLSFRKKLKLYMETKALNQKDSKPKHTYHVVEESIIEFATKANASIVIHGHTHMPGVYLIKDSSGKKLDGEVKRFEIPDWQDRPPGGYIEYCDNNFKLHIPS